MRPTAKEITRLPRRPHLWLAPPGRALALFVVLALVPVQASARLGAWVNAGCETPSEFYSTARTGARPMCCANQARPSVGVCPGGSPCPADGHCASGDTCVSLSHPYAQLPNLVMVLSDDQAYCQLGIMGACRTDKTGTPVPAPYTPALDTLARHGKVFSVAYNAANWCLPSRDAMITGRPAPQRGCFSAACSPPGTRPDREFPGFGGSPTIAQRIENAGPGYCSYQVGKGLARMGADATKESRKSGRTLCSRCGSRSWTGIDPTGCQFDPLTCPDPSDTNNPACAAQPLCGEDDPLEVNVRDLATTGEFDHFLDDMIAVGTDGKHYLPKKFMVWFAPALPHTPTKPPDIIEHRAHVTDPASPEICRDFLFGYVCDEPSPGVVRILRPRFPFAAPEYLASFGTFGRSKMNGVYGNTYWLDNGVERLRRVLGRYVVETADGPATVASNTVILFMSDNGAYLPRSKKQFTENGYRSTLIVYDPRRETAPGDPFIVDDDVVSGLDVVPTLLSYAGEPPPAGLPGRDVRARLESPSPQPVRNALCGTDIRSTFATTARYILPRAGRIGQCSAPGAAPCTTDAGCNVAGGELCGASGICAVPGVRPCVDDDDCRSNASDTSVCLFQDRKWCSNGPLRACSSDAECRSACRVCSQAPSRTCVTDGDCGAQWGPCVDAPADKLACTCGRRVVKLYNDAKGQLTTLTDLLADPDETSLVDGGARVAASGFDKSAKLAHRMRCCMDAWWLPPGFAAESCPGGCDARIDCTL